MKELRNMIKYARFIKDDVLIEGFFDDLKILEVAIAKCDSDTELLDHLQSLNDKAYYTGLCICRDSYTGRGWRLHETSHPMAVKDVRVAIKQHKESINSKHRKSEVEDN